MIFNDVEKHLPIFWFALQAPRQVLFNVVEYHLLYRAPGGVIRGLTWHDLKVLTAWLSSTQDLLLVLLAAVGLLFLAGRRSWDERRRQEFYLCAWLVVGLSFYMACPRPTYPQYFILVIPFLAILASVGLYSIGSCVWNSGRPGW